ncbi:MAG: DUF2807 domain-containing protein [Spirochaetales bacterium]|nr:DUF2807 domain-containing protein [Spirochaetales bacterium]
MKNGRKKTVLFLLVAAFICSQVLFASGAPEKGVGEVISKNFNNENFDSLTISGIENFEIVMSDSYSVKVKADENIIENVDVVQQGASLFIILPDAYKYNPATLAAVVEVPRLEKITIEAKSHGKLSGTPLPEDVKISVTSGSTLDMQNFFGDRVDLEVSVGSTLTGVIEADDLNLRIYSSCVELAGQADSIFCFSDAGSVVMNELFIETAVLDFHNGSTGTCILKDFSENRKASTTIVKLYDESTLTLSSEGDVSDYVDDDSTLS